MNISELLNKVGIDLNVLLENIRSENIIHMMQNIDPAILFQEPRFYIPGVLLALILFFFNFKKTLTALLGTIAIWYDIVHYLPKGEEIQLGDLFSFASILVAVFGVWIYMFFIRGD